MLSRSNTYRFSVNHEIYLVGIIIKPDLQHIRLRSSFKAHNLVLMNKHIYIIVYVFKAHNPLRIDCIIISEQT